MQATSDYNAQNKMRREGGYTIVELTIALAVITILLVTIVMVGMNLSTGARVTKVADAVKQVAGAAVNWEASQYSYNGVTMNVLETAKYLPVGFTAAGNPFGGAYTINGNGNSFTVTATNFPDNATCQQAISKLQRDTAAVPTCAGTTLSAMFSS